MYKNVSFKHILPLNSNEDVSLAMRIFHSRHSKNVNFNVSSVSKTNDLYINSNSRGTSLEDVAVFLRDLFSEVEIPETISFGFVNQNPSSEESGIAIFKPKVKGYHVVTARQLVEQHLNQDAFDKNLIELN